MNRLKAVAKKELTFWIALFVISFSLIGSFAWFMLGIAYEIDLSAIRQRGNDTLTQLQFIVPRLNEDELQSYIQNVYPSDGVFSYLLVMDTEGLALAHSDPQRKGMRFYEEGLRQVVSTGRTVEQTYIRDLDNYSSPYYGEKTIDILAPYHSPDGQIRGVVNIGISLANIEAMYERYLQITLYGLIAGLLITVVPALMWYLSARKQAERLRESQEKQEILLNNIQNQVWYLQDATTYGAVNQAHADFLGKAIDEIAFKKIEDIFPADFRASLEKTHQVIFKQAETIRMDQWLPDVNGENHLLSTVYTPKKSKTGRVEYIVCSADDLTDRWRAEKEQTRLERELAQSQKLESIGRLAGGIAHDFNNLLTSIQGNVSLTLMDMERTDSHYATLQEVMRASESAAELIQQLLAFSRKQLIKPKVLDLNDQIEKLGRMLGRLIGEDIDMRVSLSPQLAPISADPIQIEQILINLAVNARDAMPKGGELRIETSMAEISENDRDPLLDLQPGNYSRVVVSDSGFGIDEETLKNIFDPFFTTKPEGEGTGLGLATVYGIVKQHGGSIVPTSVKGVGTSFAVYFPAVAGEPEWHTSDDEHNTLPRGSETILVVEDEEMVRRIAVRMLSRLGYTVHEATDSADALRLVNEQSIVPDLLMTDIVMPGENGRDLARRLQQRLPDLHVLFTSGYAENIISQRGILEDGIHFLPKPYRPQLLVKTIRQILDTESNLALQETRQGTSLQ